MPPKSERAVMGTASGYFVGRSARGALANINTKMEDSQFDRSVWDLNEGTKTPYHQGLASPFEHSRPPVSPLTRPKSVAGKLVRQLSRNSLTPWTSLDRLPHAMQIRAPFVARPRSELSSPGGYSVQSAGSASDAYAPGDLIDRARPIPDRTTSLPSLLLNRQSSHAPSIASCASSCAPLVGESSLATAILRASHAEALQGGTSDLLAILGKDSKDWGFSYTHISHPCQVWLGEKDDKIGQRGARWMEREMRSCRVEILSGEGHGLMTSAKTMVTVFNALQKDVREWQSNRIQ
jgi:hypothetical protein